MKHLSKRYFSIIFIGGLIHTQTTRPMSAISKGIEIAGHIGTAVDTAMGIATVGVTLWGNDKDKERMNKAIGITSIITSLARGDVAGAQTAAEAFKGPQKDSFIYEPLTAEELADADIVPAEQRPMGRAIGDQTKYEADKLAILNAQRKAITVDDLKIAQFSDAKNQLVFIAKELPQSVNQSKIYKLLNGIEILFTLENINNNTVNIVVKRLVGDTGIEIGRVKCSLHELQKGLYIGTTNGELSIFFRDGNLIKKTILIKNMNH